MSCNVRPTSHFLKELKRLSKRYKSLKNDVDALVVSLHENPFQGIDLGGGLHKIRMAITSKGRGKSGGARVITLTLMFGKENNTDIILLTMYDKSERVNITDTELKEIVSRSGLI